MFGDTGIAASLSGFDYSPNIHRALQKLPEDHLSTSCEPSFSGSLLVFLSCPKAQSRPFELLVSLIWSICSRGRKKVHLLFPGPSGKLVIAGGFSFGLRTKPQKVVRGGHRIHHDSSRGLLLEMLWASLPNRPYPTSLDMAPGKHQPAISLLRLRWKMRWVSGTGPFLPFASNWC